MLIKNDSKNRGKWNIGVITKLCKGRDGVVRGAQLNSRKTTIDHPIQDLYPMKLSTEQRKKAEQVRNPEAKVFRPRQAAAELAKEKIKIWTEEEDI